MLELMECSSATGNREILGSWKEIVDYLGVSVRTAQQWEKYGGLPVRRGPGLRGRVFAYVDEIREWNMRR